MKIAIVCSRLCFGGAERVAVIWANGFMRNEHNVVLISNLFEEQTYHVDERITLCNLVSAKTNKIKKWCSAIWNVRRIVRKERPDVIIGVMETCSMVAKLGTIGVNIPVIMTEHYAFDRSPYGSLSKMEKLSKFTLNKFYNIVTVLTEEDRRVIGKKLNNVAVLPNPLSLSPIDIRKVNKTRVLLAIGRLDAWFVKGFDVLIRAWGKLVSSSLFQISSEGWKLQIAGTGSEESFIYLKQLCKENGVEDSVEFLGFRKDVEKLYQNASIFVLSSRYEGFGLVLIEAMSQGCACVACDYKGRQREILNPIQDHPFETRRSTRRGAFRAQRGKNSNQETRNRKFQACDNGILCEPDDVEALAEAMAKMITDDEYRESTRQNAIERSKYYSIENTMVRWEIMLNQLK